MSVADAPQRHNGTVSDETRRPLTGGIRIDTARAEDLAAMERICIDTAGEGHDPRPHLVHPELVTAIWLTPYMEPGADTVCLVARTSTSHEGGRVIGYCIAARDARSFARGVAERWFPQVRARLEDRLDEFTPADAALWNVVCHPVVPDDPWLGEHPAEVHIDILPDGQGRGLGRKLLEAMSTELGREGVRGFFLGVDPANTSAQGFYEHLGLALLRPREAGGPVYGRRLTR